MGLYLPTDFLCSFRLNRLEMMTNCTQELDEIYLAFVKWNFSLSDVLPPYFLFPMYVATPADKGVIRPSLCKAWKVNIHMNQE